MSVLCLLFDCYVVLCWCFGVDMIEICNDFDGVEFVDGMLVVVVCVMVEVGGVMILMINVLQCFEQWNVGCVDEVIVLVDYVV